MTVQVRIPTILRSYTGGAAEVTTTEGTLREVIAGLDSAYPGLGGRIIDDGGKLRRTCVSPRGSTRTCPPANGFRSFPPWLVVHPGLERT